MTWRALWVNDSRAVDLDDLFPSKPGDPLVELAKQDLDPMSIEELDARIEALKAEIARVESAHATGADPPLRGGRAVQEVMNARGRSSRRTSLQAIIC